MGGPVAALQMRPTVAFGRETVAQVLPEIPPLLEAHWDEVGHYRDLPMDPDYSKYAQLERAGILRLYTARQRGALKGYGIYLIGPGLHYRDTCMAQQSTLYVHPSVRAGTLGARFIFWTEDQLRQEGVQLITQHVKAKHNLMRAESFCRLLERRGYELQDYLYTKRLS